MNLKSRLFKKPWQHKDPEERARAVRENDDPELRGELANLAEHDSAAQVRLAALRRINTEAFWLDARLRETDADIRAAADAFLARSVPRETQPTLLEARLEWFSAIDDAELVRTMATEASDPALRRAAIARISAQGFLGDCFGNEADDTLAAEILERIDQPSTLERLARDLRKRHKKRAQAAEKRLASLGAGPERGQAGRRTAEALVKRADKLVRGEARGTQAEELERLEREWAEVEAPPEDLKRHFEGAIEIVRAAIHRPAPSEPVATEAGSSEEAATEDRPDAGLERAAEQIRAALRKPDAEVGPGDLLAVWDRAWNQLDQTSAADTALKQDMLPLLHELQAQVEQRRKKSDQQEQRSSKKDAERERAEALASQLDTIAEALEEGGIARCHELISKARSEFDRLPGRVRPAAVGGRLQRMEGRLKEMRDWQHWSNNKHRDELIEQVEQLPDSGQHPDAITAALKAAREEWQRLEKLEVLPGDRQRFAAPPRQWRRFQAACKKAFEAARPYFEKRTEVQQENLEQLNGFIERGNELAQADPPDNQALQQTMRKARQAIRRMDDLPPRERGKAAAGLRDLMDRVSKRLDESFEQVELTKRRLISEAQALEHERDLKTAIDKAKALQAQWQKAGSGRRKTEQELWKAFREPIDPLFEKLKGERDAQKQEAREAIGELEAICEQAEKLAESDAGELEELEGRMRALVAEWNGRSPRPAGLEKRFEKAEKRFEERLAEQRDQARRAAWQRTEAVAEALQTVLERRLEGREDVDDLMPEPAAEAEAELVSDLRARLARCADAGTDSAELEREAAENLEKARQILVEMEFLAGLETPESDRRLRMDYQVQRLAQRMSERGELPELADELAALERRWYRSLPLPPDQAATLAKRFQKCQNALQKMTG